MVKVIQWSPSLGSLRPPKPPCLAEGLRPPYSACTMIKVHACTMIIVHACTMIKVHVCTMSIVHAYTMIIVHACTMIIGHACTMIIVHACSLITVHAMFREIVDGGSGRPLGPPMLKLRYLIALGNN